MQRTVNIIHTADLHLSSSLQAATPALRRAVQSAQEKLLADLLALAKAEQTDILLFAGDIFDSPEPDPYWLKLLQDLCAALKGTRVFFAPGNHDPYFSEGIWLDQGWSDNVHVFKAQAERIRLHFGELEVLIDGQAFGHYLAPQALFEPLPDDAEGTDAALTGETDTDADADAAKLYRILLLHGDLVSDNLRSNYNPIMLKDPRYAAYDYLALGHVHKAQRIADPSGLSLAVYPGIPQGRGFDESGRPSLMLGKISAQGNGSVRAEWQTHSLASLLFIQLTVDISACQNPQDLLDSCWTAMQKVPELSPEQLRSACWRITLEGARVPDLSVALDYLSTQLAHRGAFYVRLYDHSYPAIDMDNLAQQSGFAALLYKRYQSELQRCPRRDEEKRRQIEKSLQYALAAHANQLSKEQLERGLDAYHELLEEVQAQ